ncbi:MAG: cytochrome b [Alphaproteobacteria bacterium]|nr:cytochrome b [Alphaproteobacteria bacterium]MDE2630827.1 cytochrome b [Alphaproteobacteria bacterium]
MNIKSPAAKSLADTTACYDPPTIELHWVTAVLVVMQWSGAMLMHLIDERPIRMIYWNFHFSFGLLLFFVIVARLWWRRFGGRVLSPVGSDALRFASRAIHIVLYLLVLVLIALGFAIILLRGWPLAGLFTISPIVLGFKPLSSTLIEVHKWTAHLLMAVAFGHAVIALFHHFVIKDGMLLRMVGRVGRV